MKQRDINSPFFSNHFFSETILFRFLTVKQRRPNEQEDKVWNTDPYAKNAVHDRLDEHNYIVKIHKSRSESACREGEDTDPPGNEIYGEGLSPLLVRTQYYKISLDLH